MPKHSKKRKNAREHRPGTFPGSQTQSKDQGAKAHSETDFSPPPGNPGPVTFLEYWQNLRHVPPKKQHPKQAPGNNEEESTPSSDPTPTSSSSTSASVAQSGSSSSGESVQQPTTSCSHTGHPLPSPWCGSDDLFFSRSGFYDSDDSTNTSPEAENPPFPGRSRLPVFRRLSSTSSEAESPPFLVPSRPLVFWKCTSPGSGGIPSTQLRDVKGSTQGNTAASHPR